MLWKEEREGAACSVNFVKPVTSRSFYAPHRCDIAQSLGPERDGGLCDGTLSHGPFA
jgi:hypothetical protein